VCGEFLVEHAQGAHEHELSRAQDFTLTIRIRAQLRAADQRKRLGDRRQWFWLLVGDAGECQCRRAHSATEVLERCEGRLNPAALHPADVRPGVIVAGELLLAEADAKTCLAQPFAQARSCR
jgi:hypothetical protein